MQPKIFSISSEKKSLKEEKKAKLAFKSQVQASAFLLKSEDSDKR